MYLQCGVRVVMFFALLFAGPSVAANVALSSTTTSECTDIETSYTYSRITSTVAGPEITTTMTGAMVIEYSTIVTVHITPLSNGTVLTSTEGLDATMSVPLKKRAITTTTVPIITFRYMNSSLAAIPAPTQSQTGCSTTIKTLTETLSITLPGSTAVITITETMLTASTLSIFHPDPATFQPTIAESSTSSAVMLSPQPVLTETSTASTVSNRPTDEPDNPSGPTRKPTTFTLPQFTFPSQPRPTLSNPMQRSSIIPGSSANALPTSPVDSPTTTTTSIPGVIRTTTLPGIGPIVIDPSRSAIFVSGVESAITPGQQTTINNVPISFDVSATFVVVDGTRTVGIPPSTLAPQPAPVVIGGTTIDIAEIATQLDPGEVTTVNGIPIALDVASSNVVIGETQTIPLFEITQAPSASMVIVDGATVDAGELATELEPGEVTVIGTMTISRDSSALIAGTTTISLASSPSDVVLGGMTITAGALPSGFSLVPSSAGGGLLLPNGQTLMPGAVTTISGVEVSLTPGATPVVVVEGSISITSTSSPGSTSRTSNGGTLETGQPTSTFTGDLTQFTGGAVVTTKESRNLPWVSAIASILFGFACLLI
ncbi:hypothetical protein ACET3X_004781 [Alternaria dauci]|uniref:Uncharacterized protein n=1 Tax=Alternaria dauci TaxID=48095 RepID=A0ABR3UID8_9PLEO